MVRVRLCEESLVAPIVDGTVRCPVHLYTGQEAVAAGVCAALRRGDMVFGTHRSHGHYLAMGGSLRALVAETYCKRSGCARGRGGSMHLVSVRHGFLGSAPIVAGTIALATGAALAASMRGQGQVAVSFFGDGAAGEGTLYESLNLAALRSLPALFVCENNFYSTHLPIRECRKDDAIWRVADAFGAAGECVDGNDVLAVHEAAAAAVAACREGRGPRLLECRTYRLRGHVGPDDNIQGTHTDLRPPEEVESWRRRDPLEAFRRHLLASGMASDRRLQSIRDRAVREVANAHRLARKDRFPDREELSRDVFCRS